MRLIAKLHVHHAQKPRVTPMRFNTSNAAHNARVIGSAFHSAILAVFRVKTVSAAVFAFFGHLLTRCFELRFCLTLTFLVFLNLQSELLLRRLPFVGPVSAMAHIPTPGSGRSKYVAARC